MRRTAVKAASPAAAHEQPLGEPLDWFDTSCSEHWRFGQEESERIGTATACRFACIDRIRNSLYNSSRLGGQILPDKSSRFYPAFLWRGSDIDGQSLEMDLTKGSITRQPVGVQPAFWGRIWFSPCIRWWDMMMVGWFSDAGGIAGVSVGGSLSMTVNSLGPGVTMGGSVLIAQYLGAKTR